MINNINAIFIYLVAISLLFSCQEEIIDLDILIENGIVYNGVDTLAQKISIGVIGDKLLLIPKSHNKLIKAKKIINAKGKIVCPGFIDPHTHADRELKDPELSHNHPFLYQGITTVIVGNDGESFYPTSKYKELYKEHGIGTNAVLLTGHGTIRQEVIGNSDRLATPVEIKAMQKIVEQEMKDGARGLSSGLFYSPGSYANTDEVVALAQIAGKYGGIYDTHLRDESSYTVGLLPAIQEAIDIGKGGNLPVHISHIKCLGVDVWNQSKAIVDLIESNQRAGLKITANQYPYDASATGLKSATVPRWVESGGRDSMFIRFNNPDLKNQILNETQRNIDRRGGPDKLLIVKSEKADYVGKTLDQLANQLKLASPEAVYKILESGYVRVASFNMNPDDIHRFMQQPWVVTGSDGNTGHPRKYGSFPRKYDKYVKHARIISISNFINQSTSKTAEIFNLDKRGKILTDYYADIIIFDPDTFKDVADYSDAFQLAQGLNWSIINGKISIAEGKATSLLNGRVLTK